MDKRNVHTCERKVEVFTPSPKEDVLPSARAERALTREETETFSRPLCDEQNLLVPISVTRVKMCPSLARETALFARDTSTKRRLGVASSSHRTAVNRRKKSEKK